MAMLPKSHVVSAQSVMRTKASEPRLSRRLTVADTVQDSGIFGRHFHIILYYKKVSSEDSGWLLAGWMKESLGRALQDQLILAGRMLRGDGELEIVANDSGVRLLEAQISKTLEEFLDLKEREDAEAELVFWAEIDEQNPQFSPLFYVQVTNFQCGAYSVGISCSLLLADPLDMISFLRKWANFHRNMVSENDVSKLPIFYLPNLKPNGSSPANQIGSSQIKGRGKTMIFKATAKELNLKEETRKALALVCLEEAERTLGVIKASKFSVFAKGISEEIEVENYPREEGGQKPMNFRSLPTCASWDDLGASELYFYEGTKPVGSSHWISCVSGEALVLLIPSVDDHESIYEMTIVVTVSANPTVIK